VPKGQNRTEQASPRSKTRGPARLPASNEEGTASAPSRSRGRGGPRENPALPAPAKPRRRPSPRTKLEGPSPIVRDASASTFPNQLRRPGLSFYPLTEKFFGGLMRALTPCDNRMATKLDSFLLQGYRLLFTPDSV